jgi:hypothetical protein
MKDFERAVTLLEPLLPLMRKQVGPKSPHTILCMGHLARSYAGLGRDSEAIELLEATVELEAEVFGPEHVQTYTSSTILGYQYLKLRKYAKAESVLVDAYTGLAKLQEANPTPAISSALPRGCEWLVELYRQWGKPDQAKIWEEKLNTLNREEPDDDGERGE